MNNIVFECGNDKCNNTIALNSLNSVKLKVLRRWSKSCEQCNTRTVWQEKIQLINIQTLNTHNNGGSTNERDIGIGI